MHAIILASMSERRGRGDPEDFDKLSYLVMHATTVVEKPQPPRASKSRRNNLETLIRDIFLAKISSVDR